MQSDSFHLYLHLIQCIPTFFKNAALQRFLKALWGEKKTQKPDMISTLSWLMMPIHHDRLSQAAHSQTDLVMEFCGDRVEWGEGANQETEYWCYCKEIMAAGSAAQLGSVDFERGKLSFTNIKRIAACLPNGKTACVLVRAPTKFHPKILYLSQLWRLSTQFLSTHICIWQKKRLTEVYLHTLVHSGGRIPPVRLVNLCKCHITEGATCAFPQQPAW